MSTTGGAIAASRMVGENIAKEGSMLATEAPPTKQANGDVCDWWFERLTPVKVLMLWSAFWASRAAFRV